MLNSFSVYAQGIKGWGDCVVDGVPTLSCLTVVFGNILFMSSALFILILFIMFVVGSFRYLTSFGNPEAVKKAMGTFRYAILGLIIFIGAYLILNSICLIFLGKFGSECQLFRLEIPGP